MAATPYILSTAMGTAQDDFDVLVASLGSPSDGVIIGYSGMPYQIYAASLNDTMAKKAAGNKIISTLEFNIASDDDIEIATPFVGINNKREESRPPRLITMPARLEARAALTTTSPPPPFTTNNNIHGLVQQAPSPSQLKMISDPTGGESPPNYTFEENPGGGTFVYVMDTSVNSAHTVST
jgi:FtsP/CotA-like multicopper oxidase with cupredoxin domain